MIKGPLGSSALNCASQRGNMWWRLLLLQLLIFLWSAAASERRQPENETICGSMELRRISDFSKLRNCSLIVGHVRIANLHVASTANLTLLRSEVTEITDYLMIYRCTGLLSLELIFPKLRLIRGRELLFDQYALTVYENRNLKELGLVELLRIQDGFIRIESNPMLCFAETVDWIYLLGNSTKQHFSIKSNKSPNHCPVCDGLAADYSYRSNGTKNCWNMQTPQKHFTPPRTKGCPTNCGQHGCDAIGNCCQRSCLTGCSAQNCTLCANFERNGRCVDRCIASFELNKRKCISSMECRQLKQIPLVRGSHCIDQCPNNHKPVIDANGMQHCQLECKGVYHVKRAADLEQLQDCVSIKGSLIIELVDIKEKIVTELEHALDNLKEITGYLKVIHSAPLMSLTFLKQLDTIRGDELIENKYALYVVNNYHLEHIWPTNRQVAVQRGTIFFHLNPRLCYEKILKLQSSLRSVSKISIADVSPNSNGERVICGNSVHTLDPVVEDINSTAARIVVGYMNGEDIETLIGYSYHYMEAPQQNVTRYDGRHGCGHDNWLMDVSPSRNRRHVISNLKPFTQYAFFVKTLTRTDYHMQMDAYSKILYFRTKPSKPSPVSRIFGRSQLSTEITVHWWPPRRPNGAISKYIINYELHNLTEVEKLGKNYGSFKVGNNSDFDCVCNDVVPYYSGPQPDDENFYNKEQITYEDALPDLIYVSRKQPVKKLEKFGRIMEIEDLMNDNSFNDSCESSTTDSTTTTITTTTTTTTTTTAATPVDAKTTVATPAAVTSSVAPPTVANLRQENKTISNEEAAKQYEYFRQLREDKVRKTQDANKEAFNITHALPKCNDSHASVGYQLEQKCVAEEELSGITLPGTQHYYKLTKLKPDQYYRISVRACVEDVVNGCSNPSEMLSRTISVEVEEFMKGN